MITQLIRCQEEEKVQHEMGFFWLLLPGGVDSCAFVAMDDTHWSTSHILWLIHLAKYSKAVYRVKWGHSQPRGSQR